MFLAKFNTSSKSAEVAMVFIPRPFAKDIIPSINALSFLLFVIALSQTVNIM